MASKTAKMNTSYIAKLRTQLVVAKEVHKDALAEIKAVEKVYSKALDNSVIALREVTLTEDTLTALGASA